MGNLRATLNQKRYISYLNRKLGLSEQENEKILNSIKTFHEADEYIKKYAPLVRFKNLSIGELLILVKYVRAEIKKMFAKNKTKKRPI